MDLTQAKALKIGDRLEHKKTKYCKHGMIQSWCAYCNPTNKKRIPTSTSGRGVGRMIFDTRPMKIWRIEA